MRFEIYDDSVSDESPPKDGLVMMEATPAELQNMARLTRNLFIPKLIGQIYKDNHLHRKILREVWLKMQVEKKTGIRLLHMKLCEGVWWALTEFAGYQSWQRVPDLLGASK